MRITVRWIASIASILVFVIGLVSPVLAAEELRVAVILRISGDIGYKMIQMMNLRTEELNAKGGINGRQVKLITYDEQCVPSVGVEMTNRAIYQDQVLVIVGNNCSGVTLATTPISARGATPQITPHSTATAITRLGSAWIFRVAIPDLYQSQTLADYIAGTLGKKRIALLHESEAMGKGFADSYTERLAQKWNLQPVVVDQFASKTLDMKSQLLKAKAANPEVLAIFGHESEGALGWMQARDVGIPDSVLRVGASASCSREVPTMGGDAVKGVIFPCPFTPFDPDPRVQEFVHMVQSRYGLFPDHNYAESADAMDIVFDALKRANVKNTPDSLAEDRTKVRDAIAAVKNYQGLSGRITFCADPTPDCRDGNRQPLILRYASGGVNATHEILQRP